MTTTRIYIDVSEVRKLYASPNCAKWPKGNWCALPPTYEFIDVWGDGEVTWNEVKKGHEGSYLPGYDSPRLSFPATICIRPLFTKDGKPLIGRMAKNIMHEWMHHWLSVNEDEVESFTFDNVYDKRSGV